MRLESNRSADWRILGLSRHSKVSACDIIAELPCRPRGGVAHCHALERQELDTQHCEPGGKHPRPETAAVPKSHHVGNGPHGAEVCCLDNGSKNGTDEKAPNRQPKPMGEDALARIAQPVFLTKYPELDCPDVSTRALPGGCVLAAASSPRLRGSSKPGAMVLTYNASSVPITGFPLEFSRVEAGRE